MFLTINIVPVNCDVLCYKFEIVLKQAINQSLEMCLIKYGFVILCQMAVMSLNLIYFYVSSSCLKILITLIIRSTVQYASVYLL